MRDCEPEEPEANGYPQSERLRTGRARGEPEEPETHMVWHLVSIKALGKLSTTGTDTINASIMALVICSNNAVSIFTCNPVLITLNKVFDRHLFTPRIL